MEAPGLKIFSMFLSSQTAANGRPVEERTQYIEGHLPDAVCPYHDSRKGKTMNIHAIKETHDCWKGVLDGLCWVNKNYAGAGNVSLPVDLLSAASFAAAVPSYCFFRARDPVPPYAALPVEISAIGKAALGIRAAAYSLLYDAPLTALTPQVIFAYTNREGMLVDDPPGIACAAPQTMIIAALAAIMHCAGGEPSDSILNAYVPDVPKTREFAVVMEDARRYTNDLKISAAEALAKMDRIAGGISRPFLWQYLDQRRLFALTNILADYAHEERDYLSDASILQKHANEALGREPFAPEPCEEDVDGFSGDNPRTYMKHYGLF